MSVLFNHACRYELFDRNPIYLVRQSAKRRRSPIVLIPSEIKALVDNLGIRERTLVLLAFSTGLRQSELFALKWGDIDFAQGNMYVTRSIVYGVVGPCKTEASQKPVPIHSIVAEAIDPDDTVVWRNVLTSLDAAKKYVKSLNPPDFQEFLIVSLKTGKQVRVKPADLDSLTEQSVGS